ncbi:acyltransferase [Salimicrobium jeotgali]|uniref:Acyltransferase n=1 Tax=Salimicrobium jeotgali TaxID=1230341 RepID=K2G7Z2_9BACI|nr:acyltransferase family protein [Salimicrobium jeotgali]AKG03792.1 acyltransferase [Salimicrobium jeotgali]EKE31278.1 acyltransferase 3 [Salimicrobium jeotgali]MBM7697090.1 peptidoglycan/LPS O-acetylase OafA/YrhL [Salimicrobium jeotgali]
MDNIENSSDLKAPEKRFRPELEGVRAVAALLVAIYHIWLGSVSGGVDVFFIVSGYLITTSLLSRMVKYGRINLAEYLLGLGKRLFPVAYVVIITVALLSIVIMPLSQWPQLISHMFSSAFYFQNWQLAFNAVDYLAQTNNSSPFQHFWALSLQGQFYVTWPLVIFLSVMLAKKLLKTPVRKTLLGVLAFIFIASMSYSIYITEVNQPWAYFDTFARAWEFSLGGMLALLLPYLRLPKSFSFVLGWAGLAVICLTGILVPVSTMFPGYAALLPISGVIMVILAAETGHGFGVEKLLGSKPFMYFGGISYGFYLWHYPLLIFYYNYFGTDTIPFQWGVLLLVVTFLLSVVSVRLVENPIRTINLREAKRKVAAVLVALVVPVLVVYFSWDIYASQAKDDLNDDYNQQDYPGALAIDEGVDAPDGVEPILNPPGSESNLPDFYSDKDCYTDLEEEGVSHCSYGQTENPDYTVALVGGSHTGHWFPALDRLSDELNMQIDVYNKDGCRFTTDDFGGAMNESCMEWNEKVIEPLLEDPPEMVFGTATVNNMQKVPEGYIEQWEKLDGVTEVFAIRDNPRMGERIPECLETKSEEECSIEREGSLPKTPPWEITEGIPDNVTFADLSEYFCDEDTCHSVVGNVIVYRDVHHISNLYSYTLAEPLKKPLKEALENLDK